MKELWDTMVDSRCDTVYNGTTFNGFLECGSRFTFRLNTAKSTNYIEKCFREKSSRKLNFLQKNSGRMSLSHQVVKPEGSKDLRSHSSALYFKNSKCLRLPCSIPGTVRDMRSLSFL